MKAITVQDSRLYGLVALYDLHTDLFISVLDGISDTDAHNRNNTKANHVAWLAGSLVQQRYELASQYGGKEYKQAAHDLFKDNQRIKEGVTYPSLEQYKKDWKAMSPIAREVVTNVSAEKMDSDFDMGPDMKFTHYEIAVFSIYREANMIGQIALWRRLMGYEPMKYM